MDGIQEINVTELDNMIQEERDKLNNVLGGETTNEQLTTNEEQPNTNKDSELSIDDKLKLLEQKEQELNKKEWKLKYKLNDDAMSLVNNEEDAAKLSKLLQQNTYKPDNVRKESLPITKEEFKKMNYNQRNQLYKQNPQMYNSLKG